MLHIPEWPQVLEILVCSGISGRHVLLQNNKMKGRNSSVHNNKNKFSAAEKLLIQSPYLLFLPVTFSSNWTLKCLLCLPFAHYLKGWCLFMVFLWRGGWASVLWLGIEARCTSRWLASALMGVTKDLWSPDYWCRWLCSFL